MSKSFDIIGSKEKAVAIIEISDEEVGKEREIAEKILKEHNNVRSVLKKESARRGDYRTRQYKLIAGDENTEVLHKEHGYALKLDPQKAYFSNRESTERQRVAKLVKAGEFVMVMFAGVGPYAIAIAKTQPDVDKIIAVEINPDAVEYMKHNVRINKISHKIVPVLGDVRMACERWYGKCDRVVMPLPLGAEDFLDVAVKCLRNEGIIHFYNWGEEPDLFSKAVELVKKSLKDEKVEYEITDKRVVLPYSPRKYKVCVEVKFKKLKQVK
jgi:tRNA (guanine37-N1)-methyltransferase